MQGFAVNITAKHFRVSPGANLTPNKSLNSNLSVRIRVRVRVKAVRIMVGLEVHTPNSGPRACVHGCMRVRVHGCMGERVLGCMGVRVHGCVGVWANGCLGVWAYECLCVCVRVVVVGPRWANYALPSRRHSPDVRPAGGPGHPNLKDPSESALHAQTLDSTRKRTDVPYGEPEPRPSRPPLLESRPFGPHYRCVLRSCL